MSELAPFVPQLSVELAQRAGSHWTSVEGSMLSADISGFTALSEKLARKGKAGAEEITEIVNHCFTALIDAAYQYGGEVLKFGGDALLVLFRCDRHSCRAVDAGLAMQAALGASPAARRARLTMTVGVAGGPFDVFLVGSDYRELLISGQRATAVILLEGDADKGDTLVSSGIASALPPEMLVREHAGGWVVTGSTGLDAPGPRSRDVGNFDLEPFVPSQVREQLSAFVGIGGEHRLVTVGFLMVSGIGDLLDKAGTDVTVRALDRLVDEVDASCREFDVTLLHTDIAPDGVKFVLCAGAPINHGDTGDAMLQAALRIGALDSPFILRQGVQTGRVFAGFLGSSVRRTYTLMGDPVNTAARMLGKAADREVVAVASVVEGTRAIFDSDELEPFNVKGKTDPIVAHKVRAVSDEVRRDAAGISLVGRREELAVLSGAISALGRVVEVVGPAGVGKSRLLDAAWDESEGIDIFQAACTPYGRSSPYSVFRPLLRAGTGIDLHAYSPEAGKVLAELVDRVAPELRPMLPLLAVPFGAEVDSTPEADAVDPSVRRSRIHDVVVQFIDVVLDGPILVVVEDLHWIDDASSELLAHLVRTSADRPWTAILTRRPSGGWQLPVGDHATVLEIGPLTTEDIRTMAIEISERPLSDADLDTIVARSSGNPLFTLELTRAISRGGGARLPDSIEDVIGARIDELSPGQRRLIRVAAVFGREFDLHDVSAVAEGDIAEPSRELDELIERDRDSSYRFRHAMYRDVAYEGLPFRHRQRLHGRVADHLESSTDHPDRIASVLSLHFSEGGRRSEAWRYSVLAGEQAAAQYAHREAASAYSRALAAARRLRDVPADERRHAATHLGDELLALGEFDAAFAAFHRARRLASGLAAIDLMRRQGVVRDRQGQLANAARWFDRCLDLLPRRGGSTEQRSVRLDVSLSYAAVRHRQGRFDECLTWADRAASEAQELGDRRSLARALDRLHVAATYLGRPEAEEYGPKALLLHDELGDHLSQARILDNMGIHAYFVYDWDRAIDLYARAAAAGRTAGDVIEANLGRANAAEVWSDRGRFDLARDEFEDVLRNWSAAGWAFGIHTARSNLALLLARSGEEDRATTLDSLSATLRTLEELGADEFIIETRIRLAEAAVHLGEHERAIEYALSVRAAVTDHASVARVERQIALATVLAGGQGATEALERSVSAGEAGGAKYELGLSCLALGHVNDDEHLSRRGAAMLDELGVVVLAAGFGRIGLDMSTCSSR